MQKTFSLTQKTQTNNKKVKIVSENESSNESCSIEEFKLEKNPSKNSHSILKKNNQNTPRPTSQRKNICPSLRELSNGPKSDFCRASTTNVSGSCPKVISKKEISSNDKSFKNFLTTKSFGKLPVSGVFEEQMKGDFKNYFYSSRVHVSVDKTEPFNLPKREKSAKKTDLQLFKPNRQFTNEWYEMNQSKQAEKKSKKPNPKAYTGRGEMPVPKVRPNQRQISFLEEVKQMALNTQIDNLPSKKIDPKTSEDFSLDENLSELETPKKDESSLDLATTSQLEIKTDKCNQRKFVIKSNEAAPKINNFVSPLLRSRKAIQLENGAQSEKKVKNWVFPSSIQNIGSKVAEPKRYYFKEQNIFCSTKSKTELFDEIMEKNNLQKSQHSRSQISISTAATSKKSIPNQNWYMQDKTKKCVRALQNPSNAPKRGYVANLEKNDPGCKKVRFLEDLGLTETSEVIGFYSGFEDKRDLKAFKKDMLTKNWKVKICGEYNME